jgi:hypothetical protein
MNPWPVKDVVITCEYAAPSGTTIGTATNTLYERIPPRQQVEFQDFPMGYAPPQAARAGCRVTGMFPMPSP